MTKELNIQKKTVYRIDYSDWDNFVIDYFGGVDYGIAWVEEMSNDSRFEYTPSGDIESWDKDDLRELIDNKIVSTFMTRPIMNYFVQKGILEPYLTYQIVISW